MQNSELIDSILGRPSNIKLIRALLSADEPVSGREAARRAGVSQRPAHRSLEDLTNLGVIHREIGQNGHLLTLNRQHFLVREGLIPLFQAEIGHYEMTRDMVSQALRPLTGGSIPDVRSVLLCGTGNRDMEVVVATRNQDASARAWQALSGPAEEAEARFGVSLRNLILTTQEASQRHLNGDGIIARALASGDLLCGRPLREILTAEVQPSPQSETPERSGGLLSGLRVWKPRRVG